MPVMSESDSEMSQDRYANESDDDSNVSEQEENESDEEEDDSDEEEASDDNSEDMDESSFLDREAEEAYSDEDEDEDEEEGESDSNDDDDIDADDDSEVDDDAEDSDEEESPNSMLRLGSGKLGQNKPTQIKLTKSKEQANDKKEVSKLESKDIFQKPAKNPKSNVNDASSTKVDKKAKKEKIPKGKHIFVRFLKAPTEDAESLLKSKCEGIVNIRCATLKARLYCLLQFETPEVCSSSLKQLRKMKVRGKTLRVSYVKTDPDKLISGLQEKNKQKLKEANLSRRQKKKTEKGIKQYATAVSVEKIPKTTHEEELKQIFPSAEKIQLSTKKGQETKSALVFFPSKNSTKKARKQNIVIDGNKLSIRFYVDKKAKSDGTANKNVSEGKKEKIQITEVTGKNAIKKLKRKLNNKNKTPPAKKGKIDTNVSPRENATNKPSQKKSQPKQQQKNRELKEEQKFNLPKKTNQPPKEENVKQKGAHEMKKFKGTASLGVEDSKSEPKAKPGSFEKKSKPIQLEPTTKKNKNKPVKNNSKKNVEDLKQKKTDVPLKQIKSNSKGISGANKILHINKEKSDEKLKSRLEKNIPKMFHKDSAHQGKQQNSNAKNKKTQMDKFKGKHSQMKIK